jgi:hypothetical protein
MVPGLEERLFSAEGNQDIMHIAELVSFNCVSDFSK